MASNHYVDNGQFLEQMLERKRLVEEARAKGEPDPEITDYIAECVMEICRRLSYRPNFIGYSYRDEMVLDGIENCFKTLKAGNFDPEKSKNPFAYFSQIAFYAFVARIIKEKKESYVKYLLVREAPFDQFDLQAQDEDTEYTNAYVEFLQANSEFDTSYFDKKKTDKSTTIKDGFDIEQLLAFEENLDDC